MRTQALRVTVGLYSDGEAHVTLIQDSYERGVLKNSELLLGPVWCSPDRVREVVARQVDYLLALEEARVAGEADASAQAQTAHPPLTPTTRAAG